MFECFKDGVSYGLRCEDHGVTWRDYLIGAGNSAGLHVPAEDGYCVDCGDVVEDPRVASFTVDECHLIRTALLDVSLALTISGNKLPYDVDVFSSVVNKLGEVGR
jgi:hypothetical protein